MLSDNEASIDKIQDWINHYKTKSMTYYKGYMDTDYSVHVFDVFDNFINNEANLNNLDDFKITHFERSEFQYNPKGLSNHLYGTPDMWFLILRCNDLDDAGDLELNTATIKVPNKEKLDEFLSKMSSKLAIYFGNLGQRW